MIWWPGSTDVHAEVNQRKTSSISDVAESRLVVIADKKIVSTSESDIQSNINIGEKCGF